MKAFVLQREPMVNLYIPLCFYLNKELFNFIVEEYSSLHSTMFLFKSISSPVHIPFSILYIPLCFYLNLAPFVDVSRQKILYIPLCFYLNPSHQIPHILCQNLHYFVDLSLAFHLYILILL